MFGLSFGELCVLMVVAIVVIGPKDLPKVLRKAGQWAGKLRRMASDVRTQSGIDDVLRSEGLSKDLAEIRRLAQGDFNNPTPAALASDATPAIITVSSEREYPREGADSYGALSDTAVLYTNNLPPSPLARDPLYVAGDAAAKLPDPPPATPPSPDESDAKAPHA